MSKNSGAIILSATATITVFAAAAAIFLHPTLGKDSYSEEVLEKARNRQSMVVATVPEPLQTDVKVLREEDRMAEKVAAILKEDGTFLDDVGDKSAVYVGERISDLEVTYSDDMIKRIDASTKEAKAYTDEKTMDGNDIVKYLLSDESFLDQLAVAITLRTGKPVEMEEVITAIIESARVNAAFEEIIVQYHNNHPEYTQKTVESAGPVPLPRFDVKPSEAYTEEEYRNVRTSARYNEIDRVLDFLGY